MPARKKDKPLTNPFTYTPTPSRRQGLHPFVKPSEEVTTHVAAAIYHAQAAHETMACENPRTAARLDPLELLEYIGLMTNMRSITADCYGRARTTNSIDCAFDTLDSRARQRYAVEDDY